MRFKEFLGEMTLQAADLRGGLEPSRQYLEPLIIKEGKHIGDIGPEYRVFKSEIQDTIQFGIYSEDNQLVCLFNGTYLEDKLFELIHMITKQEFAGQHLSAKLLIFLKTREKISIQIGKIISHANVKNFEKIAKQVPTLKVKWLNIQTKEKEEFLDNDRYSKESNPNEWRILIEALENLKECDYMKYSHFFIKEDIFDYTRFYEMWFMEE